MKLINLFLLIVILVFNSACSSSKWVVENQKEIDRNDFKLVSSEKFLERVRTTTPTSPIVSFQLKANNTFEYTQRVKTDRYIQRYRPSFRSIFFGLIGSGIATSAALTINQSRSTENILLGASGFITIASILNMKPVGEPTPTGESRLLRKTGRTQEVETIISEPELGLNATYSIFYKRDAIVLAKRITPVNSTYSVNLIEDLNPEVLEYDSTDSIVLEVYFNDKTYSQKILIKNIFEQFVVVSAQVTALRDEPEVNSRNILTDLAFGSQMRLVEEDSLWYRVLYGISETWISKTDAYPIWRPSEFASELSIIAIPNIPFGNVDVESNIPEYSTNNDSTFAFVFSNGEYQAPYSERPYAARDAQLIGAYLENSLGIPSRNISRAIDIESQSQLTLAYNRLASSLNNQQKQAIVYLSGYIKKGNNSQIELVSLKNGEEERGFNLNSLLVSISKLPISEFIIIADLDRVDDNIDLIELEDLFNNIRSNNENSFLIFSSSHGQRSRDYSLPNSDQKRHSIFTYFFAEAIKTGETSISGVINYLQRNVDYTSRRLHNQPQHIIYFGDTSLKLVD